MLPKPWAFCIRRNRTIRAFGIEGVSYPLGGIFSLLVLFSAMRAINTPYTNGMNPGLTFFNADK